MVRSAAGGLTAATMLPWVAPEVLRTPELVTGKVSSPGFGPRGLLFSKGSAGGNQDGCAAAAACPCAWLCCWRHRPRRVAISGAPHSVCSSIRLLQADAYSFAVMMWELWAMKRVGAAAPLTSWAACYVG